MILLSLSFLHCTLRFDGDLTKLSSLYSESWNFSINFNLRVNSLVSDFACKKLPLVVGQNFGPRVSKATCARVSLRLEMFKTLGVVVSDVGFLMADRSLLLVT